MTTTQKDLDEAAGAALRRMSAERFAAALYPQTFPYAKGADYEQMILKVSRTLEAIRKLCAEACDQCDGTGTANAHRTDANGIEHDADDQPCSACGGTGRMS